MGDTYLLTAGGVLDQPAGLFMAARTARVIEDQCNEFLRDTFKASEATAEEYKAHERMRLLHAKYNAEKNRDN